MPRTKSAANITRKRSSSEIIDEKHAMLEPIIKSDQGSIAVENSKKIEISNGHSDKNPVIERFVETQSPIRRNTGSCESLVNHYFCILHNILGEHLLMFCLNILAFRC